MPFSTGSPATDRPLRPAVRRARRPRLEPCTRRRRRHGRRDVHRLPRGDRRGRADRPAISSRFRRSTWWSRLVPPLEARRARRGPVRRPPTDGRSGVTSGQVQDLAPDAIRAPHADRETTRDPDPAADVAVVRAGAIRSRSSRASSPAGHTSGRRWIVEGVKLMIDVTIDNGTRVAARAGLPGRVDGVAVAGPRAVPCRSRRARPARGSDTTTHAIGDAGIDFVVRAIDGLSTAGRRIASSTSRP